MKVELTKKEIEVIIDLMDTGVSYLISHGPPPAQYRSREAKEEIVNVDVLKTKLQEYLKPVEEEKWTAIKINKYNSIEIKIGEFLDRNSAINAISVARTIDLKDKKEYFEYIIESRF